MHGIAVVLVYEQNWESHQAGDIETFPEHALIYGAVTEKDGYHLPVPLRSIGERGSHCHGDLAPDDGRCTDEPGFGSHEVHGPGFAL